MAERTAKDQNQNILQRGKEQITKVDNSRTEEKTVTAKPEAEKAEAPGKRKKISFAYIMRRMPVTVERTDQDDRPRIKNQGQDRSRLLRDQKARKLRLPKSR